MQHTHIHTLHTSRLSALQGKSENSTEKEIAKIMAGIVPADENLAANLNKKHPTRRKMSDAMYDADQQHRCVCVYSCAHACQRVYLLSCVCEFSVSMYDVEAHHVCVCVCSCAHARVCMLIFS
jgi:hypothetical protein